jgi:hypothetical protein
MEDHHYVLSNIVRAKCIRSCEACMDAANSDIGEHGQGGHQPG